MAKPICVIYYLPESVSPPSGKELSISVLNQTFRDMFPEYYILAIPSQLSKDGSCEDIRLQVFHEKDFTEIQYTELKQLIEDSIKQNQP